MADPNNILLEDWKICLMLPCKVGNSSIKAAVCDTLGMPREGMHKDAAWNYASKHQVAALPDDWYTIGFIRNPYSRFMSAWRNKMRDQDRWAKMALPHKPSVLETAQWLPRINDQHWRRLTDELLIDGEIVPDLLIRTDRLGRSWKYAQEAVRSHCGAELADAPHLNKTAPSEPLRGRAKDLVRDWYMSDFETFGYNA